MARWIKHMIKGAIMFVPSYVAFTDIFYAVRTVDGVSMQPTLNAEGNNTDFVLLNRWAASSMQFERGEVVSLVSPKDPSQWLIKRVVALEGDRLKFGYFNESVDIPKGHCWVEGDNRQCSMDSNNFGPVSLGLITAKASRVLWPPRRWGRLEKQEPDHDRLTPCEQVERGKMFFGWELE
ncbi:mitochondrial inner membrane protease subunit 2 [Aplysia californica]|uniref:Mitochondrial inner membrane protease subunit n=1 Tax=Aplysia californica TaxID=6500 RepID=A0ABM0ZXE1_APLCA|nr:mitochondrial inner membrane protease subunit 2 [Aplysia californica]